MSSKWAKIGDCVELISGAAFKSDQFSRNEDDVPLVKGENVQQSFIDWGIAKRWPRADLSSYERFLLAPNDLVVAMDRPWVPAGLKWAFVSESDPQALLVQRVARLRAKPSTSPKFLKYVIASQEFSNYVKNIMGGTNVPHISGDQIRAFEFWRPSLPLQEAIGDTLSAYDDLIENNRRRTALLEQSARLLYREWFVHLRFPGHEHVKVVDGVPEGWERKFVPDLIAINPAERIERGREAWYVPMAALSETGMTVDRGAFERRTTHTAVKFRAKDVLLARITPCLENGKTGFVYFLDETEVACGSTEFIVLRGDSVSPYFVYCLARTYDFREHAIKSMIGSSGRQRVQASCFNEYEVSLPPPALLKEFDDSVGTMFRQIAVLERHNEKLRQARDLLLPRLMSGEIAV